MQQESETPQTHTIHSINARLSCIIHQPIIIWLKFKFHWTIIWIGVVIFHSYRAAPKDAIMVNQYSIHLNLCMMHRLLFHETFSPSATYRPIMWSVGGRNGDVKGTYHVTIFYNYAALWMCLMLIKPALFYQKYRKNCNIVKYYNLKECLSILINFKI